MLNFVIRERPFSIDESVLYYDFFVRDGVPCLERVAWPQLLADLAAGRLAMDADLLDEVVLLERWVREAPRKRRYRDLERSGVAAVLSGEEFFLADGGEQIIDGLERCGVVARRFLEAYDTVRLAYCNGLSHPARAHMIDPVPLGESVLTLSLVSASDQRRLRVGLEALSRLAVEPRSRPEAEAILRVLCDGAVALQSTSDLGPDANHKFRAHLLALQERADLLQRRLDLGEFDRPAGGGAS